MSKKKYELVIADIDINTYEYIINKKNGRLAIGWESVQIRKHINIIQCYHCQGYNPIAKKCHFNTPSYCYCSGDHYSKDCQNHEKIDIEVMANSYTTIIKNNINMQEKFYKTNKEINNNNPSILNNWLRNSKYTDTVKEYNQEWKTYVWFKYHSFSEIQSIINIETSIQSDMSYNAMKNLSLNDNISCFCEFTPLTMQDLNDIVNQLQNKNSMCEGLNVIIFKEFYSSFSSILLKIINLWLKNGKVPTKWKMSTIIPIPKLMSPKLPQDLRPINMFPTYEKILDIAVHKQLSRYFEIMLDINRAFKTVNRKIFIQKLQAYKVKGTVLNWIADYLSIKTQVVKIKGEESGELVCDIGVLQGSVLGPLLFIIYMNDIASKIENSFVNLFANDTLVCNEGTNFEETIFKLNQDLKILCKRLKAFATLAGGCVMFGFFCIFGLIQSIELYGEEEKRIKDEEEDEEEVEKKE
nr:uncharacterized protein LOC124806281 [Hydra vulgaris]